MEIPPLLSSLLQLTPSEFREAIPGDWTQLEAPCDPISDWNYGHTNDPAFARSINGSMTDCVVTFVQLGERIEVSKPAIAWVGHQRFTKAGKVKRSMSLNSLEAASRSHLTELANSVAEVAALERKTWKTCQNCGARLPRGLMHDPEICMSCAPKVLGVVY